MSTALLLLLWPIVGADPIDQKIKDFDNAMLACPFWVTTDVLHPPLDAIKGSRNLGVEVIFHDDRTYQVNVMYRDDLNDGWSITYE